jgi:hypothetical protein
MEDVLCYWGRLGISYKLCKHKWSHPSIASTGTAGKWLIFWFPPATIKYSIPLTVPLSPKQQLPYTRQLPDMHLHITAGTLDRSPVKCSALRWQPGHVLCWPKCIHMQQCCKIMHHKKNGNDSFLKKILCQLCYAKEPKNSEWQVQIEQKQNTKTLQGFIFYNMMTCHRVLRFWHFKGMEYHHPQRSIDPRKILLRP